MNSLVEGIRNVVGRLSPHTLLSDRLRQNIRKELRTSLLAKVGVILLLIVILSATFAPFLAPHDPTETAPEQSHQPPIGFTETTETSQLEDGELVTVTDEVKGTIEHPLGTDPLGRDVASRLLYGARTSLLVGLIGSGTAAITGVLVGLVAGYYGGRADDALMRFADVMLAFPALVLAVALVGLLDDNAIPIPDPFVQLGLVSGMPETFILPGTVTLVIALVNWVWFARIARGEALTIRQEEYIKASRSIGASNTHIILRHVLPNSFTPILVLATIQVAAIILLESSLSFLGFSGTTLSWGFDIAQGRDYLATSWWIATFPGLAIVTAVVSINLIGDWLRDALDPGIEGETGGM